METPLQIDRVGSAAPRRVIMVDDRRCFAASRALLEAGPDVSRRGGAMTPVLLGVRIGRLHLDAAATDSALP
jgi:hypothetical protein